MPNGKMKALNFPPLAFRGKVFPDKTNFQKKFDVVLLSGDAYVDHPAFPTAVVTRCLERLNLSVAVIAQPDWNNDADFTVWGEPKKFFAVVPGAMDSMVANYTATGMPRGKDRLSPGGKAGLRPKRAAQVYVQTLRRLYGKTPIVLGGIEASLRRFVHFDFWEDRLRDPILFDAPADFIVYGMAEAVLEKVVAALNAEEKPEFRQIPQTCIRVRHNSWKEELRQPYVILPSADECRADPNRFMQLSLTLDRLIRPGGPVLIQQHQKGDVLSFPPDADDMRREVEIMGELQFNRRQHPLYQEAVPALEPVQFSIQSHRGCAGACTFCALSLHQGRVVRSRSRESIMNEAKGFLTHPDFKGVIPDVGGPAVNMYGWRCRSDGCKEGICTATGICASLDASLKPIADLLDAISAIPGIRHVFVGSGLRYDQIRPDEWDVFTRILFNHVSGQLKVAPEHFAPKVLKLMRKGADADFAAFAARFYQTCRQAGQKLFLVPYLMSAFPGCADADAILPKKIAELKLAHEQIQEFTPTPGSLATAMFYCCTDLNHRPISVRKKRSDRLKTRRTIHNRNNLPRQRR